MDQLIVFSVDEASVSLIQTGVHAAFPFGELRTSLKFEKFHIQDKAWAKEPWDPGESWHKFLSEAPFHKFNAVSEDQKYVAIACEDGLVRLYDSATKRIVWHCRPHSQEVTALAFSPDGKTLVTAGQEGMLKVWHLEQIRQELNPLGFGW